MEHEEKSQEKQDAQEWYRMEAKQREEKRDNVQFTVFMA